MTFLHALLIGAIQGLTEFLPISSDGHLILADILLNISLKGRDALGFDVLLHGGSLLALLIVYRHTWNLLIRNTIEGTAQARRTVGMLIVGTIPGVIAGLTLQDAIGDMRSLHAAGIGFLITGLVLIIGEKIGTHRSAQSDDRLTVRRALLIGIAQAFAILPGVSRSGCTISTGRALGMHRSAALDFSFLLAVPIIFGALSKTLLDAWTGEVVFPSFGIALTGFVASLLVSMIAINLLRLLVAKRSLTLFSWYLIPLGTVLLLYAFLEAYA